MPGLAGPNLGLVWGYTEGDDGWGYEGYNPGFARLDSLVNLAVLGIVNDPPGSPTDGARYIVGTAPTGVFVGHANAIAVWLSIGGPAWVYYPPKTGWKVQNVANELPYLWDGSNWLVDAMYSIGSGSDPTALLEADQDLLYHRVAANIRFAANFASYRGLTSKAGGTANPTADMTVLVQRAGSGAPNTFATIGAITFTAGSLTPAFSTQSSVVQDFTEGDVLRLRGPTTPDTTFKGFYSTLIAYRR